MRAIRKGEEEASQSPPGWAEIRPNLFVTTGNSTGAEQTNAQHGRPLPARTRLKSTPKNVVLAFSHSSSKLQPQLKNCRFSKKRAKSRLPQQSKPALAPTIPARIVRSPALPLWIVNRARGCSRRILHPLRDDARRASFQQHPLSVRAVKLRYQEVLRAGVSAFAFSLSPASNFHGLPGNGMGADCLK